MKLDINVRTAPLTRDSLLSPEECFRRAKEVGLDGVVLVEKNILRGASALAWAQQLAETRFGIRCYHGLYLHTTLGPVLLYGQTASDIAPAGIRVADPPDTLAALEWAEEQGWVAVLASPFRYGVERDMGMCARFKDVADPIAAARREVGYVIRKCRAIEVNGCAGKADNDLAVGLAAEFNIPIVVGSGAAHANQMRPSAWTKFPGNIATSAALAAAILKESKRPGSPTSHPLLRTPDLKRIYSTGGKA